MKWKAFILLSLSSLLFAQSITGEADSLEFLKDRLIYRGNVQLVRDSSVLRADEVVIYLNEENKPVKIVAKGRVRVRENGRRAWADYAEYDLLKDVIILRGSAKIQEKTRVLEAEEIIIYRKENRLVAHGKGKRVRSVYLEEKQ
ncbi:MAG: lipopolysaccharide transport periplasmic protein LptA [Aquificae bacterium]|nr:lipopolysaccharide transport periplasmic protein LptA [Aquificota bacterium]